MSARRKADEKQATLDVPLPTAPHAVERTARVAPRRNPARFYHAKELDDDGNMIREADRVLVAHLGRWEPGRIGKTYEDSVLVIADNREVPPITVYDAKYLRREE